jgi:multidrug efflux system outer membrane protein
VRYRRATEAARAQLLGTKDAQQTVNLTLVSDVAADYFLLRDLNLQLQITTNTVQTQENSVSLTELRLSHGVGTSLDVLQARQVLDTADAQIPDLERQIGQTEDAISILLGDYPHGVPRGNALGIEPPDGWRWSETLPPQLPAGLPSELLERSPTSARRSRTWPPLTQTSVWPRRCSSRIESSRPHETYAARGFHATR